MLVLSSNLFIFAFLPVCFALYCIIRTELRNVFLLIASLIFYALGQVETIWLLLLSIVLNWLFGICIEKLKYKKFFIALMLFANVGMLYFFKYFAFSVQGINRISGLTLAVPQITLPLGISFFTFRAISYCLDIAFGTSKAQLNPINTALYISFFPQLTMGPIEKYSSFEKQLNERKLSFGKFSYGARRIIEGLAKKLVIANGIAILVDKAYGTPFSELSVVLAWLGAVGYLIQLYFDFSGYCDIAIGLSNMFGFDCPENFDYPYVSKSIGEFWRRWHITLGNWLKDYLYTPVFRGLLKKKNFITKNKFTTKECDIIALFVVWVCCGAWHGAGIKFIVYGLYYYIFILCERLRQDNQKKRAKLLGLKKPEETKGQAVLSHVYVTLAVLFGQVIFRANSLKDALAYVGSMLGLNGNKFIDNMAVFLLKENFILMVLGILLSIGIYSFLIRFLSKHKAAEYCMMVIMPVLYATIFLVSVSYMINGSYNPFIYLNF